MRFLAVVSAAVFFAACSGGGDVAAPTTGGVSVTLTTTGDQPDPDGYAVSVDGGTAVPVPINGSATFGGVAAGGHTVELSGLASNCTVQGDNPRTITVVAGDTVAVAATVSCPTPAPTTGTIEVHARTSGTGTDENGYTVKLDDGQRFPIGANGTYTFTNVTPGLRSVDLGGISDICTLNGNDPVKTNVDPGETVIVTFRLTCTAPALDRGTMNRR